jgi:hypothetical protein
MNTEYTEMTIRGRDMNVPFTRISDRKVIAIGRWLKVASVFDEFFVEGEIAPNPGQLIAQLKKWDVKPDIFTFAQRFTDPKAKLNYRAEWANFAVIPITTYEHWLRKQIRKDGRVNLNRAAREGVVVRPSAFDDKFVQGIKDLCDETPVRQGMRFWHYDKSFEEIKRIHGTYCERSEYIGAYFEDELIGFLKMVYVGNIAKTMNVIGRQKYFYKRPTNALIAKAVEICAQKGIAYLNYGEYSYPGKKESSLSDFKRRNGFQEFKYPRYYVPLTIKGRLALGLGLHRDLQTFVPWTVRKLLLQIRSLYYQIQRREDPACTLDCENGKRRAELETVTVVKR